MKPSKVSPNHAFEKINKYIPTSDRVDDNDEIKKDDNSNEDDEVLGRRVLYEPYLIYSPVLASQRVHSSNNNTSKRLVTKEEMDNLNRQLQDMLTLVSDNDNDDNDTKKKDDQDINDDDDDGNNNEKNKNTDKSVTINNKEVTSIVKTYNEKISGGGYYDMAKDMIRRSLRLAAVKNN